MQLISFSDIFVGRLRRRSLDKLAIYEGGTLRNNIHSYCIAHDRKQRAPLKQFKRRLGSTLETSGFGFDLRFLELEKKAKQWLPVLMYADDIVRFANSRDELQKLLAICSSKAGKLGLNFGRKKSGYFIFCDQQGDPLKMQDRSTESWKIQVPVNMD